MRNATRYRPVRMRAAQDAEPGVLHGEATVFDAPYGIGPKTTETITRETFATSLGAHNVVPVFWGHGWAKTNAAPIGVARLRNGETGVEVEQAKLFLDTDEGNRVWQAHLGLENEDGTRTPGLREWSLGFLASKVTRMRSDNGINERIDEGNIIELSVVLKGAAPTVMRSDSGLVELREAEAELGTVVVDNTSDGASGSGAGGDGQSEPPADDKNVSEGTTEVPEEISARALELLREPGFRASVRANLTATDNKE